MAPSRVYKSENFIWTKTGHTLVGGGTYGKVLKGHRKETGDFVAIKVFKTPKRPEDVERYMREWYLVKDLRSEFIVQHYAMEEIQERVGKVVLVMELADSTVRSELLKPEHYFGLPYRLLFTIIECCVEALQYLHFKKIAHRDIKPDNILVFKKPTLRCKLCDFGGACFLKFSNEEMTEIVGTRDYVNSAIVSNLAAGHRIRGYTKDQNDMWSSASCFFECATGRTPFIASDGDRKFVNLNALLANRPDHIVCGNRIGKNPECRNVYCSDMPLQHYSYSRSLRRILAEFFQRVFAKDKSYLVFDVFYRLCKELTSLKSYVFYDVSKLCVDEYFDTSESTLFSQQSFHDEAAQNPQNQQSWPANPAVQIMQGIRPTRNELSFQPHGEDDLDKLLVWIRDSEGLMVVALPNFEDLLKPIPPLRGPLDVRRVVGLIIQMQMQERQMRLFYNTIIGFCHTCKEATLIRYANDANAPQAFHETMTKFSSLEAGNNYEERLGELREFSRDENMDTGGRSVDSVISDDATVKYIVLETGMRINGLQQKALRTDEVVNAQVETGDMEAWNELFDVNCKLITREYGEAKESLMKTTGLVYDAVISVLGAEILKFYELLKRLQEIQLHSPNLYNAFDIEDDDY